MKKKFAILIPFLLGLSLVKGQSDTTYWKKGGQGMLTFSQVGLFNWTAGGQSNMTLIGNVNLFANYAKGNMTWDNTLDLAYGFIKNDFIHRPENPVTKAEDKIDLNSKWGTKAWSDKFFYSVLMNFRTQFTPGYSVPGDSVYVSKFLAPGYLTLAAGIEFKPNDKLYLFLSPVAGKFTFVTDDSLATAGAFGVNQFDENGNRRPGAGEHLRAELGATFRIKYKADIMKNVGLDTQLDLFSNYIDRPQNIDVRWTTSIVAKINKFLSCNISTDLIYDHDVAIAKVNSDGTPRLNTDGTPVVGPGVQFKEVFGLGISYKF